MTFDNINVSHLIVFFAIYSFMGWIIEVVYRSLTQRQFINAGFFFGPFIPLYGFGAAFIIFIDFLIHAWPLPFKILVYGIILTAIEYLTGYIFEKIFKLKLWDYTNNKFNLHGRVCLLFSVFWAIMALAFVTFIHPAASRFMQSIEPVYLYAFSIIFLLYYITDFVFSIASITAFRKKIAYLYSEYFNLSNAEIENIFDSFKRLRTAFPNLSRYIDNSINAEIKNKISSFLKSLPGKILPVANGRKPVEDEFYEIIHDIYEHEEFLKLREHYHHNSSIYEHVMDVAYVSYKTSKYFNLDYRSTTRGALLHDFFLYDWRNHTEPELHEAKFHGTEHPKIALNNAQKHFELNEIEKDIVIKHMWPLTLVPPKYKESYVVSFVDKYLASREFVKKYNSKVRKRMKRPAADHSIREKRKRNKNLQHEE
ncbi:MAG: hypothetical protein QMD11_06265 [Smithella sp.]|nr:hypothetical protein [Smithella sp.]